MSQNFLNDKLEDFLNVFSRFGGSLEVTVFGENREVGTGMEMAIGNSISGGRAS